MQWLRYVIFPCQMALFAACGGSGAADAPVAPPASRGTVLALDPAGRTTAAAALTAFVNGLDPIVLDGDEVFAGMTRIETTEGQNGARTLALTGGLTAQLVPAGEGFELRFANGEAIALRERRNKAE
jgi:hypothetical protein